MSHHKNIFYLIQQISIFSPFFFRLYDTSADCNSKTGLMFWLFQVYGSGLCQGFLDGFASLTNTCGGAHPVHPLFYFLPADSTLFSLFSAYDYSLYGSTTSCVSSGNVRYFTQDTLNVCNAALEFSSITFIYG